MVVLQQTNNEINFNEVIRIVQQSKESLEKIRNKTVIMVLGAVSIMLLILFCHYTLF